MEEAKDDQNYDIWSRGRYLADVKEWSMFMLEVLRNQPNSVDKLEILKNVNKVKLVMDISLDDLPMYAATLAFLSNKAAKLVAEDGSEHIELSRDNVLSCLQSGLLKEKFESEPASFERMQKYFT